MVSFSFDMADETNTTGVFFIFIVVETLVGWEGGSPRTSVAFYCVKSVDILSRNSFRHKREPRDGEVVEGGTSHGLVRRQNKNDVSLGCQ